MGHNGTDRRRTDKTRQAYFSTRAAVSPCDLLKHMTCYVIYIYVTDSPYEKNMGLCLYIDHQSLLFNEVEIFSF